jgi:hypothetical protein
MITGQARLVKSLQALKALHTYITVIGTIVKGKLGNPSSAAGKAAWEGAKRDASGDRRGSGGCDELDVGGRRIDGAVAP